MRKEKGIHGRLLVTNMSSVSMSSEPITSTSKSGVNFLPSIFWDLLPVFTLEKLRLHSVNSSRQL